MRAVGALEACVKLPRQIPVVAIAAAAGYETLILPATLECGSHATGPSHDRRSGTRRQEMRTFPPAGNKCLGAIQLKCAARRPCGRRPSVFSSWSDDDPVRGRG